MEPRYMTETGYDIVEYKKYVQTLQGSQTRNNLIAALASLWLLAAGAYSIYGGRTMLGIFMIVVGIGAPVLVRVGAANQTERDFVKIEEAGGNRFRIRFYDDHFETQNETAHGTHEYSKLYDVIETDSSFYLEVEKGHSVIVQKKNCSDELIAFIRTLKK